VVKTSGYPSVSGACGWAGTCDTNYGYYEGTEGTDCATKKTDASSYYSSGDTICCCTTSAQSNCQYSTTDTCGSGYEAQQGFSKCGTNTSKNGKTCCCSKTSTTTTGGKSQSWTEEKLKAAGISYSGVKLEGVQEATINEIIALKKACGCTVTLTPNGVTGGTHSVLTEYNHKNGYKFDVKLTSDINAYINDGVDSGTFTYKGVRGDDNAKMYVQKSTGYCYAKEESISLLDVKVKKGGGCP
jgi:hypothetical protein